jgi:hypothetical protein
MPALLSRSRTTAVCSVLLLSAAAVRAQWQIPPGGCAVFRAKERAHFHTVSKPRERKALPVARAPHVPLLFHSDLDDKQMRMRVEPNDVRWIGLSVAFDWSRLRGGPIKRRIPWVSGFGDVRVTGRAEPPREDGWQRIELELATVPVRQQDWEDRLFDYFQRVMCRWQMNGTVVVDRRVDRERGAIEAVRVTGNLQCEGRDEESGKGNGVHRVFTFELDWQLEELRENRGAGFEARVAKAVERTAANIHEQLADSDRRELRENRLHGERALGLLALLHAEYRPTDTVLRARLNQLRRAELTRTYPLSLAILVLEKLYAPAGEREALLSGARQQPFARQPSAEDLAILKQWTERLLANRDSRVDSAYVSRWGYEGVGYDNSNTQFALLAVHAAEMCGVEVSRGVWHTAARHFLDAQHAGHDKKSIRLPLVSHAEARKQPHPRMLMRTAARSRARGFTYNSPADEPYGSMTAGGVSSMTICLSHLAPPGKRPAAEAKELDQARSDGFAYLWQHRGIRYNAGRNPAQRNQRWFYWIYSLERACELSRVAWIGDWDWYYEGAEVLMALQDSRGGFGGANHTDVCFALLFLKQAQLPVLTGPRRGQR